MSVSRRHVYSAITSGHCDVYTHMNAHISSPSHGPSADLLGRNARLALTLTVGVAVLAWFLAAVAQLSEQTIVLSIMSVAFVGS